MQTRPIQALVVLFAVGLLAGASVSGAVARATTLNGTKINHLVLTLNDLPHGFHRTLGRVVTNSQADRIGHVAMGSSARSGRVTGYQETFQRSVPAGLTEIRDAISLFRTTVASHRKLLHAVQRAEEGNLPPGYRRLAVTGVGQEASAFTYALDAHTTGVAVYFRQGRYTTEIIAEGLRDTFRPAQVVALAHTDDRRIMQVGGAVKLWSR